MASTSLRPLAVPVLTMLLLTGCAGAPESEQAQKTPQEVTATQPDESPSIPGEASGSPDETEATDGPTTGGSGAAGEETAVKAEVLTDDVLGHTSTATAIVRNFPFPETMAAVADRGDTELVLVKLKITAGEEFRASVTESDFRILTSDSKEPNSSTSAPHEAMKAAGYPPLEKVSPGASGEGWVAFTVTDATDELILQYKRLAYNGGEIPEKTWETLLTPMS